MVSLIICRETNFKRFEELINMVSVVVIGALRLNVVITLIM